MKYELMTPAEWTAIATTIALIEGNPPADESWNRPGQTTLAHQLRAWLKERI